MIHLLFIDSSAENIALLEHHLPLLKALGCEIELINVPNLPKAISLLKTRSVQLIVLTLQNFSPNIPLVQELFIQQASATLLVQGTEEQKEMSLNWIEAGAQDFFSLKEISSSQLLQLFSYSLTRQKYLNQLHALSLTDELTQCYNRRGFDLLLKQQIGIATRMERGFILFYIDLDNLKAINDLYGHLVGDMALKDTALILHQSFRIYDIIGRIGGDEFTICVIDIKPEQVETLKKKLQKNIATFRNEKKRVYSLSLSIGSAIFDPSSPSTLEKLYKEADQSLYQSKRALRSF